MDETKTLSEVCSVLKVSRRAVHVNVNIKMLEKWKIIMYVFATLLQPASLSGTVHL